MRLVIDLQGAQGISRLRGIGRYSRELALAMARQPRGHELVLALNGGLRCEELLAEFGPLLPPANIRLWRGPEGTAEVAAGSQGRRHAAEWLRAEFLAGLRPDLLHVCSVFEGASDDTVSRWPPGLERPPIVATCYDLIPLVRRADYLDGIWKGTVEARWYHRCLHELASCDGLLAISESSRREAVEHLGYPSGNIFNIRAGIAPGLAPRRLDAAEAAALLGRYSIGPDFILFLGAGETRKNESGLIRAYALLPEALRERHPLVIVGAAEAPALAAAAAEVNVPLSQVQAVRFVAEEDLAALYSLCAAFVLPSLHEGFGLPAADAMACGAPTIASDNSSLPEVVGRADALFDARNPADIASRIGRVLTDAAFRGSLVTHGLRRAATFTWADCAERAWDALEQVAAKGGRRWPVSAPRRLPRLALVSPMPPDETGIAAYAAELAPALMDHYDVTLVCERGTTTDEALASCVPVLAMDAFLGEAGRFDRVLYQIGNSQYHHGQVERLLPAVPGVVTLHDTFLSGLMSWRAWTGGAPDRLRLDLLRQHGWAALAYTARHGNEAAVEAFPCSLGVLRAALGVVQHSAHARELVGRHYGPELAGGITLIPHLRRLLRLPSRAVARAALGVPGDAFLVCSFGIVALTKRPELVLGGFATLAAECPGAQLQFVGEPLAEVKAMLPAGAATGRVDTDTYRLWLAAADVAVQLRANSRGETSGAVLDCLGAGVALVGNAHGAAAELPDDAALRLPDDADAAALGGALLHLYRDTKARKAFGAAARRYVGKTLSPVRIAAAYRDAIEAAYADGPAWRRWRVESEAAPLLRPEPAELAAVARAVARTLPSPRPPQLLLAGAPPTEADADRVRGWLGGHPPGVRVHTVRAEDGVLFENWGAAAAFLGIEAPTATPAEAEIGPGDVLLLLAPDALDAATLAAARRLGAAVLSATAAGPAEPADIPAFLASRGAG